MSNEYKSITDKFIDILDTYKATSLSDDMSTPVDAVKKGQYVPMESARKPAVYCRIEVPAFAADMAGGLSRDIRLVMLFSGSVSNADRETAWDDCMCLMNNVENILQHYSHVDGYWSGGHLGFKEGDYDNPEDYGRMDADSGTDGITVHFWLRFSVLVRINREDLT